jgi:purine-nucleoside phosphorylase
MNTYRKLIQSSDFLKSKMSLHPKIAFVLGSGLGAFADRISDATVIKFQDIPNYSKPTVEGHGGQLVIGKLEGVPVICQQGRVHYYEGHSMQDVVHPVRVLGLLGIKTVILTNAAGGVRDGMVPGELMVIRDHLNLMGANPLMGPNIDELGPRFPDMTDAYSERIRKLMKTSYSELGIKFSEGVYAGLSGPAYETPSEVQLMRKHGADAVGMSTVPETIALRHMGVEVGGISCITNLGAGLSQHKLSHEEVTETGRLVAKSFSDLLATLAKRL